MIPTQSTQYSLPPRAKWKWTQAHQAYRGDGTTTQQIQQAPPNSIYFITSIAQSSHYLALAHKLNRTDIRFVPRDRILDDHLRGLTNVPGIVVDHSIRLTYEELVELCLVRIVPVAHPAQGAQGAQDNEALQSAIADFDKKAKL